jgi:nucleotide-binding universal stress UspA family protein
MKRTHILAALSPTGGPDAAFERALALARASGAALYLLHAVPADQLFSSRGDQRLRRAADLRRRAEAAGVDVRTAEQHGDPAEIIVLHAEARQADLIVMGSERRTGWARFRRPSIAERVLRRTTRPTLIVSSDDAAERAPFERVVIGVDLAPESGALVDAAIRLLRPGVRHVTAVHAVDSLEPAAAVRHPGRWTVPEYRRIVLDRARQQLSRLVPSPTGVVEPRAVVAAGPAAAAIVSHAADAQADVIVVGGSRRFMHLGSTAGRVLRDSGRALLVIPPAVTARALRLEPTIDTRAA